MEQDRGSCPQLRQRTLEEGQVWLKAMVEKKKEKEEHELFLRPVSIEISGNYRRGHVKLAARCIGLDLRVEFWSEDTNI